MLQSIFQIYRKKWQQWLTNHWPLIFLFLVFVTIYYRSITFPFVNWDDPIHVYRNPALVHSANLTWTEKWLPRHLGYPMPVTLLTYRLDQTLSDSKDRKFDLDDGKGFHRTNLLIGFMIVALVYFIFQRLLANRVAACLAAMIFAVHPIIVEPIVWISGRKDLLSAMFGLSALIFWLQFLDHPRRQRLLLFFFAAVMSLGSKPNAIFLLPLAIYAWWCSGKHIPTKNMKASTATVLALLATIGSWVVLTSFIWNRALGGVIASPGFGQTLRRATWGLGYHLMLLVAPFELRPKYVVEPASLDFYDLAGLTFAFLSLTVLILNRRRISALGIGAFLFLSCYLPSSSLIPLNRFIADSYLFLPWVGISLMLGALMQYFFSRISRQLSRFFQIVILVFCLMLGIISHFQVDIWSSSPKLWHRTFRYHPNIPQVCRMLGEAYNEQGELSRAVQIYQQCSQRFGPELFSNNLAITLFLMGELERAETIFNEILRHHPDDPRAKKFLGLIRQKKASP